VSTAVAVALALVVLAILLWPNGYAVNRGVVAVYAFFLQLGVPPWVKPEAYAALLNVLAFVPLGWLGVVAIGRRPLVVAASLVVLSVTVELAQALPGLARDTSVGDVVLNGLGGLLGVGLAVLVSRGDRPSGDQPS
jgi:glycopeptide antibiotics resistance protein